MYDTFRICQYLERTHPFLVANAFTAFILKPLNAKLLDFYKENITLYNMFLLLFKGDSLVPLTTQ